MRRRNRFIKNAGFTRDRGRNHHWFCYLFLIFILYRLVVDTFGDMGFVKYSRMKSYLNSLTTDIARLKQDNARLAREVNALKTSPDHMETVARDKLGLSRPGEIIYYYSEP